MFDRENIRTLEDRTAYSVDGDKIGKIHQIFLDDNTDEPTWVTVSTGWFGTSESFVPLEGADLDEDGNLRVAYTKDVVKDAPRIDPEGHLDVGEQDELFRYYQASGYDADRYGVGSDVVGAGPTAGPTAGTDTAGGGSAATTGTTLPAPNDFIGDGVDRGERPVADTSDEAAMAGAADPMTPRPEVQGTSRVRLRRYEATPEGALGQEGEVVPDDSTRLDRGPGTP